MTIFKVLMAWLGCPMVMIALETFPDPTVGQMMQLILGLALLAWACPFITDTE